MGYSYSRLPGAGEGDIFAKCYSQWKMSDLNSNDSTENHRISDHKKPVENLCFTDKGTEVQREKLICLVPHGLWAARVRDVRWLF